MTVVRHKAPARWTSIQLALAACLVFTMLLSGTEAGRLLTSVRAIGAGIGAVLILAYLVKAPRHHDLVDGLVLAGLLAFLVTCITSSIPRLSFEAATSAIAYAAAFYVARGAVSDQRGRDLAVLLLGILGTILSLLFLIAWASVWIRWTSIVGGGLPPLDLTLPSAPFAPIRVAILIGLLTPATILLARRPRIWPAGVIGTAASFAVILMSGSRSVWLGVIAAAAVAVALGGGRRILRMPRPALVGAAAVGVGLIAVVGPQLVARLATGSTIELRVGMWSETIARWLESPLLGYGPGTFPAQFNLTDYYNTYEPWTSHPHNAVVQLLLEGGIVGVIGLGFVAAAVVAGVRRAGHLAWAPAAAIGFLAAVSLTENPTLIPYLIVPLIVWVALAMPRVPAEQFRPADARLRAASLAVSMVVAAVVVAHLAAAAAYDRASTAADKGNRAEVVRELTAATSLDRSFPFYQRELGAWLLAGGDVDAAHEHLRRALELNPADQAALRLWALLSLETGDERRAVSVAGEAQSRADLHVENALTLAYIGLSVGDDDAVIYGLVRAVRREPWLLAAPEWDVVFPTVSKDEILIAAGASWADADDASARNLRARTWLNAMTGMPPPADAGPALRAEAALLACEPTAAAEALGPLDGDQAADATALQARLMIERAFGGSTAESDLLVLLAAHDQGLQREASSGVAGTAAADDHNRDVKTYSRIPIRPPIGPILPTPASGLSAWLRDPIAAADAGAPGSGLAACR